MGNRVLRARYIVLVSNRNPDSGLIRFDILQFTDFQSFQLYAIISTLRMLKKLCNQLNQLVLLLTLLYILCWLHLVPQRRAHAAKPLIMSARNDFRSWRHYGAHFSGCRLVSERRYSWRNTKSTVRQFKENSVATNTNSKLFIINQLEILNPYVRLQGLKKKAAKGHFFAVVRGIWQKLCVSYVLAKEKQGMKG